ncbi:iron transporter [Nitrospira sp. T9]|uniref:iron transporter n=1 Tax=unclassified Nitrospira TaxID=2652172 RepID=UPI003F9C13F2
MFSKARRSKSSAITWITVSSRVGAAACGGYALTYACTAWLSVILPLAKSEAVLTASMMSFVIYTAAILWAFAAITPMRAWLVLLISTGLLGGMTLLMT